jgi:hypothetical protein
MDKLHKEIAKLEATLADANLFTRDPKGFDAGSRNSLKAREDLAKSEEQWLELEMKRERTSRKAPDASTSPIRHRHRPAAAGRSATAGT